MLQRERGPLECAGERSDREICVVIPSERRDELDVPPMRLVEDLDVPGQSCALFCASESLKLTSNPMTAGSSRKRSASLPYASIK